MSDSRPIVALLVQPSILGPVVSVEAVARLEEFAEVRRPEPNVSRLDASTAGDLLAGAQGCILSWGSPRLEEPLLQKAPGLKMAAYAAGSVKGVVSPELFDRGVLVTSAAPAIASEVALYALGAILCGLKGVFPASRTSQEGGWKGPGTDATGSTVGIIGAGHVGRRVISLLKGLPNGIKVLLYDPRVDEESAESMGVTRVELEDLLASSDAVSVHAPSLPSTRHLLNASNLPLLRDGATLVNSARGSLIDPEALAAEMERRPGLQAIIDVTDPEEPPGPNHPYRRLPNVVLTPHLAGTVGPGKTALGDLAVEELHRHLIQGEPPLYPVTREMLEYVA